MPRIKLDNITLDFPLYSVNRSFKRSFIKNITGGIIKSDNRLSYIKSIDGISADICDGDRVGIIGHNGAGKTTLLKVLAGIYPITTGKIEVEGVISSLFTTSPGLDMDDTGYETIFNCGMLLGISRDKREEIIEDVEDFTELGGFLNLPVRTYSAGMLTRLCFAIATSINPEILLLDEGLGAGDTRFTKKAKIRTENLIKKSSILMLASHSNSLVQELCNKAMLMDKGKLIAYGPIDIVFREYEILTKS
jgi:ABC-type polysaccharide/polyol phosphate transport system ATPase subunit